jgi:hypothetical protein
MTGRAQVDGTRSYGIGPNRLLTQNAQSRLAYCEIWEWARNRSYPTSGTPCAGVRIPYRG